MTTENNGAGAGNGAGQGSGGDGKGGGAAPWYGELAADTPQDFKDWVTNKGYKDARTALESNFNLEKLVGFEKAGRTLVRPKDENDVEGIKAFNKALGVPDNADLYELPKPEGDDGSFAKIASGWFHQAGVPKAAAQKIAEAWNKHVGDLVKQGAEQDQANANRALEGLKTEWGKDFDANSEVAKRGLKAYGQKAGLDEKDLMALESSLGTAKMLKLFVELGKTTKESEFVGGDNGGGGGGFNVDDARKKLDEAKEKRIAGKMTEAEYYKEVEKWGPLVGKKVA